MNRVLIIGGTSYVGEQYALHLKERGYQTFIYARKGSNLFLLRDLALNAVGPEAAERLQGIHAVLNFGFVKGGGSYHDTIAQSEVLAKQIARLVDHVRPALMVQISSQAVFGNQARLLPRRVARMCGNEYADGKLVAEHILEDELASAGIPLAIVRLGNVMGEYAPNWTWSIVDRILDLATLAEKGAWGFSNSTYVHNIADYLRLLIETPAPELHAFGTYHHLAEFSSVSWDKWVIPMGAALGIDRGYLEETRSLSPTVGVSYKFRDGLLRLARGTRTKRFLQRQMRRLEAVPILRHRLESIQKRLPYKMTLFPTEPATDGDFRGYMTTSFEFHTHALPRWRPPYDFGIALEKILSSLHET
jgi:nucleoside-diphosphate-sugar epimerase